jgi:hypothetical protein
MRRILEAAVHAARPASNLHAQMKKHDPQEAVTPETLTMSQIAQVERHARKTGNTALRLACQRAANTSRFNLAALRRVASWINANAAKGG